MVRSFFVFLCCLAAQGAVSPESLSLAELQIALAKQVSAERFASAQWGIKVVSLSSGAVIFETNAARLLKPGSNAKLFTAALALDTFGPDYKIRTSVYSPARPGKNGALAGDLIVYGRGDFSMSSRFRNGSYSNLLGEVVEAVKKAGVRSISGDLIGDETFFRGPRFGSGWTWDDLNYYYGAEVSALSVQDNVIDLLISPGAVGAAGKVERWPNSDYLTLRTKPMTTAGGGADLSVYRPLGSREFHIFGSLAVTNRPNAEAVTVPNPALWCMTILREALAREGVKVRGKARSVGWPERPEYRIERLHELGFVESRPMRELIERMLKPSQNLYAQLLLLQAGARGGETNEFSETLGVRALRSFLETAGIDPRQVLLEEGSGLSRSCLVTPNAIVQLLQHVARHPHASIFAESLPEPGEEGTLRRRLPDLKGRVRAKTGTLRYVNALSGYADSANGERLAFAIMLNAYNPAQNEKEGREEIDAVLRLICRLSN